jgi:hypothetical protein
MYLGLKGWPACRRASQHQRRNDAPSLALAQAATDTFPIVFRFG